MEISQSTSKGSLVISDEAVSSIVVNAAKDVAGVTGFSNRPADVVTTIRKGSLKVMSPVRVLQEGDDLNISVYIVIESGKKIQPIAEEVQRAVKESVQNMTGKLVSKVNVIIASVDNGEQPSNAPTEINED